MLNFDDPITYELLLKVCKQYKVDPSTSIAMEDFFRSLLNTYDDDYQQEKILSWMHLQLAEYFVAIDKKPDWIQGEDWPIVNGKPMIFVGQLNINSSMHDLKLFHDDTSFYIFTDVGVSPVVIIQQY